VEVEVVEPGRLTLREQVELFARTAVLVGDHGAGLANLVFMRPGAAVLELTNERCGRHCGDYFRPLAALMNLSHAAVPPRAVANGGLKLELLAALKAAVPCA
jgi:capsular polysaccharide biosynthesis protein